MKRGILFSILLFWVILVKAQGGYNYRQFGVGLDASYERGYTNLKRQYNHYGFAPSIIYNYSPFLQFAAEFQIGKLSGGGLTVDKDQYGRQYVNNFKAFVIHGDIQAGELMDQTSNDIFSKFIKNFYAGTGIGVLFNNNTVQRTNVLPQNGSLSYVFPGKDKSINTVLPIRLGYEFKIYGGYDEPVMALDLGYVQNFVFGGGLDGYDDPGSHFKHNAINQYRQIMVGAKFYFGSVGAN